jgi:hypothetical protein
MKVRVLPSPDAQVAPEEIVVPPPTPLRDRPAGQIVETARPLVEEKPEQADYLAMHDQRVEVETRADAFKVNPDVLAPQFSRESKYQVESAEDLGVDKPSTGARAGNHQFAPGVHGNLAGLPSPSARSNRPGLEDPVPASHASGAFAGAPQNDRLDEKLGAAVALNTREYLYAGYFTRIRQQINPVWDTCLDDLSASNLVLTSSIYETEVHAILDSAGALEVVEVTDPSGQTQLDACVVLAFRLGGPFPNPPEGLIESDGRVYLPDFSFTVTRGTAQIQYQGVDPRAGVMFPGILKSPR